MSREFDKISKNRLNRQHQEDRLLRQERDRQQQEAWDRQRRAAAFPAQVLKITQKVLERSGALSILREVNSTQEVRQSQGHGLIVDVSYDEDTEECFGVGYVFWGECGGKKGSKIAYTRNGKIDVQRVFVIVNPEDESLVIGNRFITKDEYTRDRNSLREAIEELYRNPDNFLLYYSDDSEPPISAGDV